PRPVTPLLRSKVWLRPGAARPGPNEVAPGTRPLEGDRARTPAARRRRSRSRRAGIRTLLRAAVPTAGRANPLRSPRGRAVPGLRRSEEARGPVRTSKQLLNAAWRPGPRAARPVTTELARRVPGDP